LQYPDPRVSLKPGGRISPPARHTVVADKFDFKSAGRSLALISFAILLAEDEEPNVGKADSVAGNAVKPVRIGDLIGD
jgi:hypothetical protein